MIENFILTNIQTLALINFIVQILLIVALFVAAYLAKIKRKLTSHCTIMRIAVPVQIVTILAIMLPSMLGYIKTPASLFNLEVLVHHVLGVVVVVLWILINLAFKGIIKIPVRLALPMRVAFGSWLVTFILGLHIYLMVWI